MLLQASINNFKWFTVVVEILKTVSYDLSYHWTKKKNIWKECTAKFRFYFFEKWQTISPSQSLSETFVDVFYAQYLRF